MYAIDERDTVVPIAIAPPHETGAPTPIVFADDGSVLLAYRTAQPDEEWAIIEFPGASAHYFGSPNDETLNGHPLHERGLGFYGIFEVRDSSWIRTLERMNRVHPQHDPRRFAALRHFVFTFHDRCFECVAQGLKLVTSLSHEAGVGEALLRHMTGRMKNFPQEF